jgi:cytidyltransferase-like protein
MEKKTIAISGGFDPIHPGHIAMIEGAMKYGEVHIIVNSDAWLVRKKGFYFQPFEDRKKILEAYTPHIHEVDDSDGTVCEALRRIRPSFFGNGGDRTNKNTPELEVCNELGIEPVFELGGGKYASSSMINGKKRVTTEWGWYDVLIEMPLLEVKILHIDAGKSYSLEKRNVKNIFFFQTNGQIQLNLPGVSHVLTANKQSLEIIAVEIGSSTKEVIIG